MVKKIISVTTLLLLLSFTAMAAEETDRAVQSALHILDYISVDYPAVMDGGKIKDQAEYNEQKEFASQLVASMNDLSSASEKLSLQKQASDLLAAINKQAPGPRVAVLANQISAAMVKAYHVKIAPASAPSVDSGAKLFRENCSACHGMQGYGDGPQAMGLEPPPANFHNRKRQSQRSIYGLYNTISLGVTGTAMPGFSSLSEADRWSLAFYVSNFFATDAERSRGEALWQQGKYKEAFISLSQVTGLTPAEAEARYGKEGDDILVYLRSAPNVLAPVGNVSALEVSLQKLHDSLSEYQSGHAQVAYDLAVAAYLQGFELMERSLSLVDPELRHTIEIEMAQYRNAIKHNAKMEDVVGKAHNIENLLHKAAQRIETETLSPGMGAFSAFILLLREGLEAILVLAAIIAFLTKADRRDALPYVHAGWISALLLGLLTWVVASNLVTISGANREITEGATALVAAAMLIYMGYWLHSNANAQRWKQFIDTKLHGALNGSPVWALVTISFIAVYREVFETILLMPCQHLLISRQQMSTWHLTLGNN